MGFKIFNYVATRNHDKILVGIGGEKKMYLLEKLEKAVLTKGFSGMGFHSLQKFSEALDKAML